VRYALEASRSHGARRASNLGHAEIEGSEPSPGILMKRPTTHTILVLE
jgi:hypothetical protein